MTLWWKFVCTRECSYLSFSAPNESDINVLMPIQHNLTLKGSVQAHRRQRRLPAWRTDRPWYKWQNNGFRSSMRALGKILQAQSFSWTSIACDGALPIHMAEMLRYKEAQTGRKESGSKRKREGVWTMSGSDISLKAKVSGSEKASEQWVGVTFYWRQKSAEAKAEMWDSQSIGVKFDCH